MWSPRQESEDGERRRSLGQPEPKGRGDVGEQPAASGVGSAWDFDALDGGSAEPGGPTAPWGRCLGVGGGLMLALWTLERSLAPDFGEGLALRWLRSLADHPWRSGLALGLLALAVCPWRREVQEISSGALRGDPDVGA